MWRIHSALVLATAMVTGFGSSDARAVTTDKAQTVFDEVAAVAALDVSAKLTIGPPQQSRSAIADASVSGGNCQVYLVSSNIAEYTVDQVAGVFGHELAHCALHHNMSGGQIRAQLAAWPNEYAADELGVRFAHQAGYDGKAGLQAVLLNTPESLTHPAGTARVAALNGAAPKYRALVRSSGTEVVAAAFVVKEGRVTLGGFGQ